MFTPASRALHDLCLYGINEKADLNPGFRQCHCRFFTGRKCLTTFQAAFGG